MIEKKTFINYRNIKGFKMTNTNFKYIRSHNYYISLLWIKKTLSK